MRPGNCPTGPLQEREFMEDILSVNDRVRITQMTAFTEGFAPFVGREGVIEEQDENDPDGFVNAVHIDGGPVLNFANSELEKL
jgi:hypothetical protein